MTHPASTKGTDAPSRLANWCDRFIEAGWLAAVVITPLFLNVFSLRIFEADKLTLLRAIALLMAAAWGIKRLDAARAPADHRTVTARTPLVAPVLALIAVTAVSTAFSVAPRISLFGDHTQRFASAITLLSVAVLFFMIAQGRGPVNLSPNQALRQAAGSGAPPE
ncbi:MAG: hypothetical protein K1X39_07640 [Thermoflexales bacterium]|nr:hypothetical protein [Thermoflexales bacterium]